MRKKRLNLGTRGSQLALWQANWVKRRLEHVHPDIRVEIIPITTHGDRNQTQPLPALGGTGVFVKEIEHALREGTIDFAVHSAKDLPSELHPAFKLAAITAREDPRDVLLSHQSVSLAKLPTGARLATGSPRRKAQLLIHRPDLEIVPLRGNLDTRIRKLQNSDWHGIVAAWAGVKRLGYLSLVVDFIPLEICLPAAGQGALALEILSDHSEMEPILHPLTDPRAEAAIKAERAFLKHLGAGCTHPVGVLGWIYRENLYLDGLVAAEDGIKFLRQQASGSQADPEAVGASLAQKMLDRGVQDILHNIEGAI